MTTASTGRRNLFCALGLFILIVASLRLYATRAMASIPSAFTIEIDGKPITRCSDDSKDKTHAKTGTDAAVFKLENNRLKSDGWTLARSMAENKMLGPKQVMWYRPGSELSVQDVTATKDGDSYQLKFPSMYDVDKFWQWKC
jgi:hypothetical protein